MEDMRSLLRNTLGKSLSAVPVEDRLAAAWPLVCGRAMALNGTVVRYEREVVEVIVSNEVWLKQMMSMQGQLAEELAKIAGIRVSGIHFTLQSFVR